MAPDRFSFLPDSTNAVEAHNRISKSGKAPEPLAVALMSLYKKDMVTVLEGLAEDAGISTSYVDRNPAAREKRNKRSNIARRKRQANDINDAQSERCVKVVNQMFLQMIKPQCQLMANQMNLVPQAAQGLT